ncbi:MAG: NAD(P)/FAD-dependent oxidoreductase [Reyranellaceae bacterium]
MSVEEADFLVVGAGIAGASAGYWLAQSAKVIVLERESQPGYHSTGRSAALFSETYGNFAIRAITVSSGDFFDNPPPGFAEHRLVSPRGALIFGNQAQLPKLDRLYADWIKLVDTVRRLDQAQTLALCPLLNADKVAGAVFEPDAKDIDVHATHQGFLRALKGHGGHVQNKAEVLSASHSGGKWLVKTSSGDFAAPVLINAAGAWCDVLAGIAGVKPVGLVPMRRTAFTFDGPPDLDYHRLPMVLDADEEFYFKPEVGQFLASPADETPVDPCDVQPEEYDIAEAAAQIEEFTSLRIRRINNKWAGLRSFVADRSPVVGFDDEAPGFFWLAGQGGYGIQTSPAMGEVAAALALRQPLPARIAALGVTPEFLSPARLRR